MLAFLFNSFLFLFLFLFSLFGFRIRVRVTSWLYCYTAVTLDEKVTVIVTSHKVTEKDVDDSGRMILYNVYNIWLFRVG